LLWQDVNYFARAFLRSQTDRASRPISIATSEQSFPAIVNCSQLSLHATKSFLSPFATNMENKDAQQQDPKSTLGLLIVEGGFEDQVCSTSGLSGKFRDAG
jgi:hypothetical protein